MNHELYHYGVAGMKWGVRKSKEERFTDWKRKQHSRLDKQTGKDQAKWDKKISKAKAAIGVKGATDARREKLRMLEGKKKTSKALNKIAHTQIDSLKQKDYDEIVDREIKRTATSAATIALAAMGQLPLAYFHAPNTNLDFKDYRVRHSDLESPDITS